MREFKIGQCVYYHPRNRVKAEGRYVVMRLLPQANGVVIGGPAGRLGFIWPLASARLAIGYRPTMGPAGSRYFVRLLR